MWEEEFISQITRPQNKPQISYLLFFFSCVTLFTLGFPIQDKSYARKCPSLHLKPSPTPTRTEQMSELTNTAHIVSESKTELSITQGHVLLLGDCCCQLSGIAMLSVALVELGLVDIQTAHRSRCGPDAGQQCSRQQCSKCSRTAVEVSKPVSGYTHTQS